MNLYETKIKLYKEQGYVPIKNEVQNIEATALAVAARRSVNLALKEVKAGKNKARIKSLQLTVKFLSNIDAPNVSSFEEEDESDNSE